MDIYPPTVLRSLGQILVCKSGILSDVLGYVSYTYRQILYASYKLDTTISSNVLRNCLSTWCIQVLRSPNFFLGIGSR